MLNSAINSWWSSEYLPIVNQIITLLAFSSCNLYFMNFPLAHIYFPLHINWSIIHVIFFSERIIIDIIVYERKIKTCINILLSFSIHILSFAHAFTHNSRYFSFRKIITIIIVYGRKRKTCIIFRRKINGIIAWWFLKDINWHHCFIERKKMCIVFEKKINNIIAWWKKN